MTSFRRKQGTYKVQEDSDLNSSQSSKKKMMTCFVDLLDDNTMNIEIERQSKGVVLLEETFKRLDLVEKDYFGLLYTDNETGLTCWLESHKKIRKQNRGEHILKFKFCVKFYVAEPGKLSEEYTRYLFYLQSRQDLLSGKLSCNIVTATQLASFVVHAELGDYDPANHTPGYVSELRLLPSQSSHEDEEIAAQHRKCVGMKCEDAEYKFLEIAKRLPTFGVDFHPAIDHENIQLQLGVMASGIVVYLKENKINSFSWAKIIKISFKKKKFYIHIRADNDDKYQSQIIGFKIVPYRACKNVWKRCVEYHTFFRLNTPRDIPSRGVLRLGSKHHYKGRTQKQAIEDYNNLVRTNSNFERTPSKRVSRRKIASPNTNNNHNASKNNHNERSFYLNDNDNSNSTPVKKEFENENLDFASPTSPNHASTPSDVSGDEAVTPNARFDYDTKTGQIEINLDSTLNTSTPSVNGAKDQEDCVDITIMPDASGKFGFNVRGGYDQEMPVIVSKVARGSPAAAALPCLEEGDQVVSINNTEVEPLDHKQIVGMIQSSSTQYGQLNLVVRKPPGGSVMNARQISDDLDASRNSRSYELPELPKFNPDTANLLDRSITILQKSLQDGTLSNRFNNLYRQTPGVTMVAAKLDENHSKNRFRDIIPYDTTRVRLQEGNDYINASYVDVSVGSDQLSYIASQGPMSSTIDDHWQMIWEQEVELIVMVVDCIEKKSIKCTQYWPEPTQTAVYRNIEVSCVTQSEFDGGIEREFEVSQDGINKTITHLHYTGWPHHGTPDDPAQFVNFIKLIGEKRKLVETPVLVHCSEGIGRTGVVALLEGALNLIESKCGVYPLDMVTALRDQRPKLIQNYPLFKFACESILYLYSEETSKSSEKEKEPEETETESVDKLDGDIIVKERTTENNGDVNLIAS
ncbi:tyrosine-protein phosphatase non-receptor type 4-like [Bolinopsis microptera]|uniref:tyrosine-protein phosphatase non-receptor type 4-like n=1 Tax=Bolinopsis microptera TaxID=2820187 RepID=UPI00307A4060